MGEASVPNMVQDISLAVRWVLDNLEALGGDPDNDTLMGQSAGAHLSAMLLVQQAEHEAAWTADATSSGENPSQTSAAQLAEGDFQCEPDWSLDSVARWVGISGPYDIVQVMPTMRERGLPRRVIRMLMDDNLPRWSPTQRIQRLGVSDPLKALSLLPDMHVFSGTADQTVHWHQ